MLNSSPQFAYERAYLATLRREGIYEFDVVNMPVAVAVDANGTSEHDTEPKEWSAKIGTFPVVAA